MRIGLFISSTGGAPLERMIERFHEVEAAGLQTAWAGHTFDWDALTLLALAGRATTRIELGSWVVPAPTRHPVALAQQAITTQLACSGRLALGIGASHPAVIEKRLGLDASRPLRVMREQLALLPPLLAGEQTEATGELYRVAVQLEPLGSTPPPVLLAALGPRMLELAGRAADGVAIWLGGERFLEDFALPLLDAGARSADRPRPRVVVGLPLCITRHPTAREAAERYVGPSARLPAYRKVLDRQGLEHAAAVALMGDEEEVSRDLERLAALGVTDFNAIPVPVPDDREAFDRTLSFLADRARAAR